MQVAVLYWQTLKMELSQTTLTILVTLGIAFMETDIAHVRMMTPGLGHSQLALMKVSSTCFVFLIILQATCKLYQVCRLCVGVEWSEEHSKHNNYSNDTIISQKNIYTPMGNKLKWLLKGLGWTYFGDFMPNSHVLSLALAMYTHAVILLCIFCHVLAYTTIANGVYRPLSVLLQHNRM